MNELTKEEFEILELTAELYNKICALPDKHPSVVEETALDIHRIQHRVMARLARRIHPEFFYKGDK